MRKVFVLTCIVSLLIPAALLVGCGEGVTEQALNYVKQADQLATERGSKNTELLEAWRTVREAPDPAVKSAAWEDAESVYGEVQALVDEEKAEYEKVEGLDGVEDYAKYAELKIAELTAFDQLLTAT